MSALRAHRADDFCAGHQVQQYARRARHVDSNDVTIGLPLRSYALDSGCRIPNSWCIDLSGRHIGTKNVTLGVEHRSLESSNLRVRLTNKDVFGPDDLELALSEVERLLPRLWPTKGRHLRMVRRLFNRIPPDFLSNEIVGTRTRSHKMVPSWHWSRCNGATTRNEERL